MALLSQVLSKHCRSTASLLQAEPVAAVDTAVHRDPPSSRGPPPPALHPVLGSCSPGFPILPAIPRQPICSSSPPRELQALPSTPI